jgi:hypothetical protein
MLKTFSKYAHVALALSLILALSPAPADARPGSSSSFKSGFSSQRSSSSFPSKPSFSSSPSKPAKGSFGSFRPAPPSDGRKSDSALSRKLDRESAQANALRTLDERRAAQAARNAQAAPGAGWPAGSYQDNARTAPPQGYGPAPAQPPANVPTNVPIIVRQDSGLGHVVAGAILARSAANAHANDNGYYPASGGSTGELANKAGAGSIGASAGAAAARDSGGSVPGAIARTFLWLCVLSLVGWCAYFIWKRAKARREADKPNYSFERN